MTVAGNGIVIVLTYGLIENADAFLSRMKEERGEYSYSFTLISPFSVVLMVFAYATMLFSPSSQLATLYTFIIAIYQRENVKALPWNSSCRSGGEGDASPPML